MEQGLSTMNVGLEFILMYSKNVSTKFCPVFKKTSKESFVGLLERILE